MRYRAEIDGLRAIAVVPVILFHAGIPGFSGGFVGVDVFFVISGFLITSLLLEQADRGGIAITHFYERRARRILPALVVVVLTCIPLAWALLLPADLKDFSQSLLATATFSSNFLFWQENGYFDTAAELKPLLHTWSLAIEEQYYLLFPLLLIGARRLSRPGLAGLLLGLSAAGFAAGTWLSTTDPKAAFYLLPTRGWAILIGALVALYARGRATARVPRRLASTATFSGLLLIVGSITLVDGSVPYPGVAALAPTLGTALVLSFASADSLVTKILSLKPLVLIGLISYSAYLWHQPLLAFARYRDPTVDATALLALCALSLVLAFFTWKYVETPLRSRSMPLRRFVPALAVGLAAVLTSGVIGVAMPVRPPSSVAFADATVAVPLDLGRVASNGAECDDPSFDPPVVCSSSGTFSLADRTLVVIGDSHARVLGTAFFEKDEAYTSFVDLAASGCPFLLGLSVFVGRDRGLCTEHYQTQRLRFIGGLRTEELVVVVAARLPLYLEGTGFDNTRGGTETRDRIVAATATNQPEAERRENVLRAFEASVDSLRRVADMVVLVKPTHTNGWHPVYRAIRLAGTGVTYGEMEESLAIPMAAVTARTQPIDDLIDRLAAKYPSVYAVDPKAYTCDATAGLCFGLRDGRFLFTDADHLAPAVNERLVDEIVSIIEGDSAQKGRKRTVGKVRGGE